MLYFTHISNSYSCTNSLQKAILKYLESRNRKILIDYPTTRTFMAAIVYDVKALCDAYPRCKPMIASFYATTDISSDTVNYHLDITEFKICNFNIYQAKN